MNRIDSLGGPARMSTNLTIDRQTPKTDFGDRMKAGIDNAAGAVASGAAIAAPLIPGGSIISAAVSSVTTMGNSSGVASSASYGTTMTTLGAGGSVGATTGTSGGGNYNASGGNVSAGQYQPDLNAGMEENRKLISMQIAMQRENQVFSTISNVLKVRHDTVKNSISNVR
jgi:hypothetical protein